MGKTDLKGETMNNKTIIIISLVTILFYGLAVVVSKKTTEVIDNLKTTVTTTTEQRDQALNDLNHAHKLIRDWFDTAQVRPLSSIISVDMPVAYYREAYVSADLVNEKGLYVGTWMHIDGVGLFRVCGVNKRGKNTIRVASTSDGKNRQTRLRKVSWLDGNQ